MIGLHVDSVRKQFGDRQILNDIFISCEPGQIIGLLGRNGSGKSTLLKVIFGSLTADNKFVAIDNRKVDSLYSGRKLIHYLPQDNFLPNHIKIRDLIYCFCDKENVVTLMENDLIKPFLQKKISQLSGGEKRIVEILFMVNSEAKYLLLDEPFNGVSPLCIEIIKDIIKNNSKNMGIIMTDHDYENILDVSSRVILMDNGNTKVIKEFNELIEFGYLI